jgi:hypothetical protein
MFYFKETCKEEIIWESNHKCNDNIKVDIRGTEWRNADWTHRVEGNDNLPTSDVESAGSTNTELVIRK